MADVQHFETREEWLNAGLIYIRETFQAAGYDLPEAIKVSCGFAPGDRGGKTKLGCCIYPDASAAGNWEIFVSPCSADPVEALDTLTHEAVHVAADHLFNHRGHGNAFKSIAHKVGLEGQMRSAKAGPRLRETLQQYAEELGKYPHDQINMDKRQKQKTYLLKVACVDKSCGFTFRTTHKQIEKHGGADNLCCPACASNVAIA